MRDMKCETCGHTKSKHSKQRCTFPKCLCKKFRKVKERPTGDDALVKLISESVEIKIDGKKLLDKFRKFTEKVARSMTEDQKRRMVFTKLFPWVP